MQLSSSVWWYGLLTVGLVLLLSLLVIVNLHHFTGQPNIHDPVLPLRWQMPWMNTLRVGFGVAIGLGALLGLQLATGLAPGYAGRALRAWRAAPGLPGPASDGDALAEPLTGRSWR